MTVNRAPNAEAEIYTKHREIDMNMGANERVSTSNARDPSMYLVL
jgi:hypothetical protein